MRTQVGELPTMAEAKPSEPVDEPEQDAVGLDRDPASVYRQLAPAVLGYLRGQGAPDPEGILGEVFLHVARDLHRVEGGSEAIRRWVFTVARHRLVDERRRRAARPQLVAWPRDLDPPGRERPSRGFDAELVDALGQLTARQREVVVLRFVSDLPLATVAEITGKRVGAVKSLQQRGLARLRRALDAGDVT